MFEQAFKNIDDVLRKEASFILADLMFSGSITLLSSVLRTLFQVPYPVSPFHRSEKTPVTPAIAADPKTPSRKSFLATLPRHPWGHFQRSNGLYHKRTVAFPLHSTSRLLKKAPTNPTMELSPEAQPVSWAHPLPGGNPNRVAAAGSGVRDKTIWAR